MIVYASFAKKVLINLIQGHCSSKFRKRSDNGNLKVTGLHMDHPPALEISNPASVGVKKGLSKIISEL